MFATLISESPITLPEDILLCVMDHDMISASRALRLVMLVSLQQSRFVFRAGFRGLVVSGCLLV